MVDLNSHPTSAVDFFRWSFSVRFFLFSKKLKDFINYRRKCFVFNKQFSACIKLTESEYFSKRGSLSVKLGQTTENLQ